MDLDQDLAATLCDLQTSHRFRRTESLSGTDRLHLRRDDGGSLLSFCGNDYLGLAAHPAVLAAAHGALESYGMGAGASRLVAGQTPLHRQLEADLAQFLGAQDALLFPTGYQANLGVLTALAGPDDLIVSDAANHASIIDGCRLSRARIVVYPHGDSAAAAHALAAAGTARRRLLVTESIFSMDGDRAPLAALAAAARQAQAVLVVDEAHAIGVAGPRGRGVAAETGVIPDVTIGTLGKALGSHGGFVAGSATLRSFLVNRARQFIYTTAGPAAVAAAASAALAIVASPIGEALRLHANTLAAHARVGLRAHGVDIPGQDLILPAIVGDDSRALALAATLRDQGILAPAIRPPTVAPGTARLRLTISAGHTLADVDLLLAAFSAAPPRESR